MKYIVVLGDGMSDEPFEGFHGKTALECAVKPEIDYMASRGVLGTANTVPEGMPPGSDTANLSVMGYDPKVYYSGRSPFEAASIGIDLLDTDVTFRVNFVTLEGEGDYNDLVITDHSADEITTEEADALLKTIASHFKNEILSFYTGISYRHIMVWKNGPLDFQLIPPHDILGKKVGEYMPKGSESSIVDEMMRKSYNILKDHPVNKTRASKGLRPANSIWIWGEGKKPTLTSFKEKYNLDGAVISAVDLIKGIGVCAGLEVIEVEGATGNLHTNFTGKAEAAFNSLKNGKDFIYVHVEAPDECSHRFEPENKIKSIELIDSLVVKYLREKLAAEKIDYRMLVLPDHPTPLALRTHTSDAVPFVLYQSSCELEDSELTYTEKTGIAADFVIPEGHKLMDYFLGSDIFEN